MPLSDEQYASILQLLYDYEDESELLSNSDEPSNYAELKEAIINRELDNEISEIQSLLDDHDHFKDNILHHIQWRAKKNLGTAIGYEHLTSGLTNLLDLKLLLSLYQPTNLAELLQLILPEITRLVTFRVITKQPDERRDDFLKRQKVLPLVLKAVPIDEELREISLAKEPEQVMRQLANYVFADDMAFNVTEIPIAQFKLMPSFYRQLTSEFPQLKQRIFKKNTQLTELQLNVETYINQGQTFQQALEYLVESFFRGGESATGETFANVNAQAAFTWFYQFLKLLPKEKRETFLQLENGEGSTLETIISQIGEDITGCIELAARSIKSILTNSNNKAFLQTIAAMDETDIDAMVKGYRRNIDQFHEAVLDSNITLLPEDLVVQVLNDNDEMVVDELIVLLHQSPISLYPAILHTLLKQDEANGYTLYLLSEFDEFDDDQKRAIIHCLLENAKTLEEKAGLIAKAFLLEVPSLIIDILSGFESDDARKQFLLNTKLDFQANFRLLVDDITIHSLSSLSLLELFVVYEDVFKYSFSLFNREEQQALLTDTDSPLLTIALEHELLLIDVWQGISEKDREAYLFKKFENDKSVIQHIAKENPPLIAAILQDMNLWTDPPSELVKFQIASLTQDDFEHLTSDMDNKVVASLLQQGNVAGQTVFHMNADNHDMLKLYLQIVDEDKRLKCLLVRDNNDIRPFDLIDLDNEDVHEIVNLIEPDVRIVFLTEYGKDNQSLIKRYHQQGKLNNLLNYIPLKNHWQARVFANWLNVFVIPAKLLLYPLAVVPTSIAMMLYSVFLPSPNNCFVFMLDFVSESFKDWLYLIKISLLAMWSFTKPIIDYGVTVMSNTGQNVYGFFKSNEVSETDFVEKSMHIFEHHDMPNQSC